MQSLGRSSILFGRLPPFAWRQTESFFKRCAEYCLLAKTDSRCNINDACVGLRQQLSRLEKSQFLLLPSQRNAEKAPKQFAQVPRAAAAVRRQVLRGVIQQLGLRQL